MASRLAHSIEADLIGVPDCDEEDHDTNRAIIDVAIEPLRKVVEACMTENRNPVEVGFGGRRWECAICKGRHKSDCPVPAALELLKEAGDE